MNLKTLLQQLGLEKKRAQDKHAQSIGLTEAEVEAIMNDAFSPDADERRAERLRAMSDDDLAEELKDEIAANDITVEAFGDMGHGEVIEKEIRAEIERRKSVAQ